MSLEIVLIGASLLLLLSIFASKVSDRFGVPALLLFLGVGMLAGSDGIGGIYFDDARVAQAVGSVALVLILFSGGLDTDWKQVRGVLREGLTLATLGVLLTAVVTGFFVHVLLGFSMVEGLLVGAIVSSTDAAAVFSVLRSKGIHLKGNLKPLLELESGSNDPMAIFLTTGLIQLLQSPALTPLNLVGQFFIQMLVGGAVGFLMSWVALFLIRRLKLGYEGLYPVLTLALAFFVFGLTNVIGGNGYLAVYLVGVFLSRHSFIHRQSLLNFHDGMAWLMQIAMFLTLGLLVFPTRLLAVSGVALVVALCLMLLARPLGVFISLLPFGVPWRDKLFISWVGLRGAVPIILATYPMLAGLPNADLIFNVVFFVVLTSVLLQGTTLPLAARWLSVDAPAVEKRRYPIKFTPMSGLKSELKELLVPEGSAMANQQVVDLGLPAEFLIVMIARGEDFLISSGGTQILEGDVLLVLSDAESLEAVLGRYQLKVIEGGLPR